MRRVFRIHHDPAPGETVQLVIDYLSEAMKAIGGGWWEANAEIGEDSVYYYRVVTPSGSVSRVDHGRPRRALGEAIIVDRWRAGDPTRLARHSTLFKAAIGRLWPEDRGASGSRLTIRLHEPSVPAGHRVAVVGSDPSLGAWDESRALRMVASPFPWWTLSVDLTNPGSPGEYSFVVVDKAGTVVSRDDEKRLLPPCPDSTVVTDESIASLPEWRGSGVAVPVFSLRTDRSFGVGEFRDLIPFADWAAECGISLIQLLPINDTINEHAWADSYPYDPISVKALHPLYVDLHDLPGSEDLPPEYESLRAELNDEPEVAYERVMAAKLEALRSLYSTADDEEDLAAFRTEHWDWLAPYAHWCVLRDTHGTSDMRRWGPDEHFSMEQTVAAFDGPQQADLEFWVWVQYHLHRQLAAAVDHVHSLGIALKGDLPIGVAPNSVETWTRPELFHLGTQTGAPPDDFTALGQNWGFPTYDWDAMADDEYDWWKDRFRAMALYADAYRIDHILGFFRIWEIPGHAVDGLLGTFRPHTPLTSEEITTRMPAVDVDWLMRPMVDFDVLKGRFGEFAPGVRERCFTGPDGDLRFVEHLATQREIVEAAEAGTFDGLGNRTTVVRNLLDLRADAPLMAVEGGYHPRISWHATEAFRRLPGHEKDAFNDLANDFFHRRHTGLWRSQGMRSLPSVVDVTPLLPCGEDLGMVPEMVPTLMREMGVLSLEIERMPKQLGAWRAVPGDAPYLSVVSPATHDMAPIRLWWEEDRSVAQRYWNEVMGRDGEAPATATVEVCQHIVRSHLESPAMLSVIQLQDLLATDESARRDDIHTERINIPADRHHRWRYRCHLKVSELPVRDWSRP